MKNARLALAWLLAFGLVATGAVVASASTADTSKPVWITADGKPDFSKMPDSARVPYKCWNDRQVELTGKQFKQKMNSDPKPGSAEHELGMAKVRELRGIPGVVTTSAGGTETLTIDDSNPKVEEVMKKYEAKETPQCQ